MRIDSRVREFPPAFVWHRAGTNHLPHQGLFGIESDADHQAGLLQVTSRLQRRRHRSGRAAAIYPAQLPG